MLHIYNKKPYMLHSIITIIDSVVLFKKDLLWINMIVLLLSEVAQ